MTSLATTPEVLEFTGTRRHLLRRLTATDSEAFDTPMAKRFCGNGSDDDINGSRDGSDSEDQWEVMKSIGREVEVTEKMTTLGLSKYACSGCGTISSTKLKICIGCRDGRALTPASDCDRDCQGTRTESFAHASNQLLSRASAVEGMPSTST